MPLSVVVGLESESVTVALKSLGMEDNALPPNKTPSGEQPPTVPVGNVDGLASFVNVSPSRVDGYIGELSCSPLTHREKMNIRALCLPVA